MSFNLENNCIKELLKDEKTEKKDLEPIYQYLESLKIFLSLLKNHSLLNYDDILKELSKILKFKKVCKNELVAQQGDIGENFYIVLKGHLKIILLRPYEYYMSEEEYILYLLQLRINNQTEIINQCNHFNSLIYPIPENFDNFIKDLSSKETKAGIYIDSPNVKKKAKEVYKIISEEDSEYKNKKIKIIISPEEYTKMNKVSENIIYNTKLIINFINNGNNTNNNGLTEEKPNNIKLMMKDKKKIIIPCYEIFSELAIGSFFGESSLESSGGIQECSIIAEEDETHLAYINKKEYYSLIHQFIEKRKLSIFNIMVYFSLYRPINQVLFERKYLNFFRDKIFDVNKIIFNEGDEWGEMYFITDGEYELSVNKNIIEVNEMIIKYKEILKKLNKSKNINNKSLNINEEIKQNNSLMMNQKFNTKAANKLILDKKFIKLSVLYAKDIIGLSDVFLYNNENQYCNKDNDNNNYNKPTIIYGEQIKKKCLVTCKCLTYNCHAYSLNNNIFNNLYYNEGNYNISTKNSEIKRIYSIIERLEKHKDYIFELVNKEKNKFSKKLKKYKFFTKNPKFHQKGKLDPKIYHNIITEIKTNLEKKEKNNSNKLNEYKKTSIINDHDTIFNNHLRIKDKFDFNNRQFFPSIPKNMKSNIINKYSLHLKLMKRKENNSRDKNETIYSIYNKNSNDNSQNNLTKLLIHDFLYEKFFYNYTFNDLNILNFKSQKNTFENKILKENISNINNKTNLRIEDSFQNEFLKSFSYDKNKKVIKIKKKNNIETNEVNRNSTMSQTNIDFSYNFPETFKSNYFSIDGNIFEKKYQNKIVNTVSKIGKNKIKLTKIKKNNVYDPLAFEKFNNFFNLNFRRQYIMSDIIN